jgi:TPR repeat protein
VHSFSTFGNMRTCPFCKAQDRYINEDVVEELMKRVNVQDGGAMCELAKYYYHGLKGLQQDQTKAIELLTRAAKLGSSSAHHYLGIEYDKGGDLKKAKFHFEAAAMAGHDMTRHNLASLEGKSGFVGRLRAMQHLKIGASSGSYTAMHCMQKAFEQGLISRDEIDSILTAYNNSCAEMRSEARDAYMRFLIDKIVE